MVTPEVGGWAEDKYRLVRHYADMFTTSMKKKWDHRVYIDLFAGAGRSRIEGSGVIVPASPILTLELPSKFDKYIFCERDEKRLYALKTRVERIDPDADVTYIAGDVNEKIQEVLSALPSDKVLTFCFVDPYRIADLRFDTLRLLSSQAHTSRNIDFLVLLPSFMDVNRNAPTYLAPKGTKALDGFLGSSGWRGDWKEAEARGEKLGSFFVEQFGVEMKKMGYLYPDIKEAKLVRGSQNVPLYHLAFFSRHPLGAKFWRGAKEYGTDQRSLPSFD